MGWFVCDCVVVVCCDCVWERGYYYFIICAQFTHMYKYTISIGYALAYAVIQFFCQQIDACVMFSTHYHSLVEELKDDKVIYLSLDKYIFERNRS